MTLFFVLEAISSLWSLMLKISLIYFISHLPTNLSNSPNNAMLEFSLLVSLNTPFWPQNSSLHTLCRGVLLDDYTLATISKVCGEIGDLNSGKLIHGKIFKIGFVLDFIVANSLMSMYNKCGEFGECLKLFDEMPERNVGAWNVIISGYADSGDLNFYKDKSDFVKDMQIEGLKPDVITVSSHLSLRDGDMVKKRASCNKVDVGRRVFDSMKGGNVYTWTAMINGYVKNGSLEEGLVLFQEIQVRDEVELNKASLVSVLPACSAVSGLIGVKQIHGYAIKKESNDDVSLCNALIGIYSKCESLDHAKQVFEHGSFHRDPISWSSMISGYGLQGNGEEAIFVYNKMLHLGNKSDMIAIVGVLSACGRSGLVDEGLRIYKSTINEYRMKPTVEICACVVNMLGRSGQPG
ncbi:hypothetical protein POTOM_030353 [Populus tomentosa]|uniref:Pentatricopeptide repeat-containing protein n=1 Tax=Populus tomentosa TaxID=118781 RepID=A0A8X8CTV4_POPTO|nr:hypothetical protein POTOM_030353 [Populus tomentosa]